MQYVQAPYTKWTTAYGSSGGSYENFYSNGTNRHRHQHLSSNASSRTDGSSTYGSSTSYLFDMIPSATGRTSPELQSHYKVLNP